MARSARLESGFQDRLRMEIEEMLPGCKIFKMDQHQGIPDLIILYHDRWAMLENKKSRNASHRPNQEYWVDFYDRMAFARFIFPENKDEVLDELYRYFK